MKINKLRIELICSFLILMVFVIIVIIKLLPGYKNTDISDMVNLVINNSNVTEYLKKNNTEVFIDANEIVYISINDIRNFFDEHIYLDEKYNNIISTYNTKVMTLNLDNEEVYVNGEKIDKKAKTIYLNGIMYLPFSVIEDVYNAKVRYIKETNTVIIDTFDKDKIVASIVYNTKIKARERSLSRTIQKIEKGDCVIIIFQGDNWSKIRTDNGKIGFIKNSALENLEEKKSNITVSEKNDGRVNLVWDYFSIYSSAPNRDGQQIHGLNVISPSFFSLIKEGKGEIYSNVGEKGKKYIEWAHNNKYKVWAIVSNESLKDTTSEVMKDYKLRENLIENILEEVQKYNLDGINIDFENMYMEDKDLFSRFIIELKPRLQELEKTLSVDVTAPDGAETWSMCYDRNTIGEVADYIIFMAYDQYGESSTTAGTTSGYNWVKVNLNKFINTEEVETEKIILGLPFYTRVWSLDGNNKVIKKPTVSMKNVYSIIPKDANIIWDDSLKQNVAEYKEENYIKKIWIEDEKSFKEKLSLINLYNLGGVATWRKDMELDSIWRLIDDTIL